VDIKLVTAFIGLVGVLIGLLFGHIFTEMRRNNETRLNKLEELLRHLMKYKRLNQLRYDQSIDLVELGDRSYNNLVDTREQLVNASDEIRLLTFTYFRDCESVRIQMSDLQQGIEPFFLEANLDQSVSSGSLKKQFWLLLSGINKFEQSLINNTKLPT